MAVFFLQEQGEDRPGKIQPLALSGPDGEIPPSLSLSLSLFFCLRVSSRPTSTGSTSFCKLRRKRGEKRKEQFGLTNQRQTFFKTISS